MAKKQRPKKKAGSNAKKEKGLKHPLAAKKGKESRTFPKAKKENASPAAKKKEKTLPIAAKAKKGNPAKAKAGFGPANAAEKGIAGGKDAMDFSSSGAQTPPSKHPLSPSKKIKSGIKGLDEMLGGGFPAGSLILLAGSCGTGKSTFAMQFLYNGAAKFNEPGVYVSLEEEPEQIIGDMAAFGWDIKKLVSQKKIIIIKPEIYDFDALRRTIVDAVDRIGAKRLVVDSFALISMYFKGGGYEVRKVLLNLDREIKKLGCTTLAISDVVEGQQAYSSSGMEEFIVDGVVAVHLVTKGEQGETVRTIQIRKMRSAHHMLKRVPFEIEKGGITVYSDAEVF